MIQMLTTIVNSFEIKTIDAIAGLLVIFLTGAFRKMRIHQKAIEKSILALNSYRLADLSATYLKRGHVNFTELKTLEELFEGYSGLGGNGTIKKLYEQCQSLPIKED